LCPEDRDFLRFLWVTEEGVLKIFRHAHVAFSETSSPFLLGAVIDLHLKKYCEEYTRDIIDKLRKSFYVDNCITSVENKKELLLFIKEASMAGMSNRGSPKGHMGHICVVMRATHDMRPAGRMFGMPDIEYVFFIQNVFYTWK
jgi:hypothetical protein